MADQHKDLLWLCADCKAELQIGQKGHFALMNKLTELDVQLQTQVETLAASHQTGIDELKEVVRKHASAVDESLHLHRQMLEKANCEQARLMSEMASLNKTMLSSHKQLVKEQEKQKGTYADVVKSLEKKIHDLPSASAQNRPTTTTAREVLNVLSDKERRRCNIVVHNLKESSGNTHNEKMLNDQARLTALIRDVFQLQVGISKSFRAGNSSSDREKPRLMVATLDSEAAKWELIKMAPQLRNTPGFTNIYINPDLTKEEREEGKKLRQELARRKRNGETGLVIRRGKIVNLMAETSASDPVQQQAATVIAGQPGQVTVLAPPPTGSSLRSDHRQADSDNEPTMASQLLTQLADASHKTTNIEVYEQQRATGESESTHN